MEEVIGLRGTAGHGSLKEWGVTYRELSLAAGGLIDWTALRTAIRPGTYALRAEKVYPRPRKSTSATESLSQAEEVYPRQRKATSGSTDMYKVCDKGSRGPQVMRFSLTLGHYVGCTLQKINSSTAYSASRI